MGVQCATVLMHIEADVGHPMAYVTSSVITYRLRTPDVSAVQREREKFYIHVPSVHECPWAWDALLA